jgi:hypothetical protein
LPIRKKFSSYINNKLKANQARFGVADINEDRMLYKRSVHFEMSGSNSADFHESEEG